MAVPSALRTAPAPPLAVQELADEIEAALRELVAADHWRTRYLANLRVKALAGKDPTGIGCEGPFEGAFVSGPSAARVRGQPIEQAQKRARRWLANVDSTTWLRSERPELFAELEQKLW